MTNKEKALLRSMAKDGKTFEEIRRFVDCADATIKKYVRQFQPQQTKGKDMSDCKHDADNAIRKGRAHYVCPLCGEDISLMVQMLGEIYLSEKFKVPKDEMTLSPERQKEFDELGLPWSQDTNGLPVMKDGQYAFAFDGLDAFAIKAANAHHAQQEEIAQLRGALEQEKTKTSIARQCQQSLYEHNHGLREFINSLACDNYGAEKRAWIRRLTVPVSGWMLL